MIKKLLSLIILFVFGFGWFTTSAQQINTDDLKVKIIPNSEHVCVLNPTDVNANLHVKPSREMQKKLQTSTTASFEVDYGVATGESCGDQTWPSDAIAAFDHAMEIWGLHLRSDVPIKVQAIWREIESDEGVTLGSAGPYNGIVVQSGSAGESNTFYSLAQLTAMTGIAIREQLENPVEYDIGVNINCDFNDWYFGTDGNTPAGRIDFTTVVLHEIGHGIGFFGTMFVPEDEENEDEFLETGGWGLGDPPAPVILDRFGFDGESHALLSESVYPNPSLNLYEALTGQRGGLFFDGEEARNTLQGEPARLYAPEEWSPGSSFSHVDQETYSQTVNALMRPRMDRAQAVHSPGPLFCGMLSDIGWPLGVGCLSFLAADAVIALDRREIDFGVTNAGEIIQETISISSDPESVETLSGALEIEDDTFTISGNNSFSLEPGESVELTIQYRPRNENNHSATLSVFHNAKNEQSPISVALRGKALEEDQIVQLDQSFPNPVVPNNPSPKIPYAISEDANVSLDLYTIHGQKVQTLVNTVQPSGRYEVEVDMNGLSSGVYIYRIVVDNQTKSGKLMFFQ
jgi:hypothetical protein